MSTKDAFAGRDHHRHHQAREKRHPRIAPRRLGSQGYADVDGIGQSHPNNKTSNPFGTPPARRAGPEGTDGVVSADRDQTSAYRNYDGPKGRRAYEHNPQGQNRCPRRLSVVNHTLVHQTAQRRRWRRHADSQERYGELDAEPIGKAKLKPSGNSAIPLHIASRTGFEDVLPLLTDP